MIIMIIAELPDSKLLLAVWRTEQVMDVVISFVFPLKIGDVTILTYIIV